jgi:hypothetical protein
MGSKQLSKVATNKATYYLGVLTKKCELFSEKYS